MDEQRSEAVTEAFVRLYKEGLIYRLVFHTECAPFFASCSAELMCLLILCCSASSKLLYYLLDDSSICRDIRLVNWDCTLRTAISDIEVCEACTFAVC